MEPKIAQVLFCRFTSAAGPEDKLEYKSRTADYDQDYMLVEIPINTQSGQLKTIYVGDELTMYYLLNGRKYQFNTSVLGFRKDPIPLVVVKRPDPQTMIITYIEDSFFQVSGQLELAVKGPDGEGFVALTEDISGGSVTFSCDGSVSLQIGTEYRCWLLLQTNSGKPGPVPFKGELVRSLPFGKEGQIAMIRFTEILESDRQEIVRYCFEKERTNRKA